MNYSELAIWRLSHAKEKYDVLCPRGEMNYTRQTASRLSHAEEEYHLSCHSSSEEQSIESGEEEEEEVRLTGRGQRYQSLLEKRKKQHSAPSYQDEKENTQLN